MDLIAVRYTTLPVLAGGGGKTVCVIDCLFAVFSLVLLLILVLDKLRFRGRRGIFADLSQFLTY